MKSIFFYLVVFLSYFSLAQGPTITWKVSDDSISVLKPYFNDEFQDDKLNKDKWLDIYQWGGLDFKTRMKNFSKITHKKEMVVTMSNEYAKITGENENLVFETLWKLTETFQYKYYRKKRLKKKFLFWKK